MADNTNPTQLSGLFKESYGDSVENLIPECALIQKAVSFVPSSKETGNKYNQPVVLSQEHGVTYGGSSTGAFSLNESVAMTMQNARLEGSQLLLRSALSYDSAAKASNSKKAFMKSTELLVENMVESVSKRLELSLLYGQSAGGLGIMSGTTNVDATNTTLQITTATWATGIWAGMENATLDFYDGTTKINTTGSLSVASVDLDNKTVTVTGVAADITAIDGVTFGGNEALFFEGAYTNEMAGIDKIITNTGSLFDIDAAVYNLWKGNVYGTGSADLTIGKILKGLAQAVGRGLDEKVKLYVSPVTWENLNDDLAALRSFDSSYKASMGDQGNEAITYYGQNGKIEVCSHLFVKEGEAFALPASKCRRVGSQDVSFKTPGGRNDEIFRHLENRAGYEMRVYTDQALLIEKPAACVKFDSIVNS